MTRTQLEHHIKIMNLLFWLSTSALAASTSASVGVTIEPAIGAVVLDGGSVQTLAPDGTQYYWDGRGWVLVRE